MTKSTIYPYRKKFFPKEFHSPHFDSTFLSGDVTLLREKKRKRHTHTHTHMNKGKRTSYCYKFNFFTLLFPCPPFIQANCNTHALTFGCICRHTQTDTHTQSIQEFFHPLSKQSILPRRRSCKGLFFLSFSLSLSL